MRKRKGFGDILGSGASATLAGMADNLQRKQEKSDALELFRAQLAAKTDAEVERLAKVGPEQLKQDIAKAEAMGEVSLAQELRRIDELGPEKIQLAIDERLAVGRAGNQVDSERLALMAPLQERFRQESAANQLGERLQLARGLGSLENEQAAERLAMLAPLQERFRQESARNQLGERLDAAQAMRPLERQWSNEDLTDRNQAQLGLAELLDPLEKLREDRQFSRQLQLEGMRSAANAERYGERAGTELQLPDGVLGKITEAGFPLTQQGYEDYLNARQWENLGKEGASGLSGSSTLAEAMAAIGLDFRKASDVTEFLRQQKEAAAPETKPAWWKFWK